ncbi:AmpG family muropeptide MFS transporter [Alcaligenes endophyticus]|uniref:MFS transporter n=1 Tax=Alcaligenes endophyticus TaxID=1929088 RepID=A0ABT8EG67_9BURK|nr:MFS transporter [Alcaligenes endophyticus]MCX5590054.1 MFS transporter [Alcaligenes endophyticus]MDN4120283.1 MFS transporter [Alcaligenes endophyticus]
MSFVYFSPRVFPLLVLGFASGLPLALVSGTLQAWLTTTGSPEEQIGLLTLAGSAYTLKFLWAPLIDRYCLPFLGRRRGWMLLTQVLLAISLLLMSRLDPSTQLGLVFALAFWIAFLSATQDIAFDAYSTDVLQADERAAGAAVRVTGYRIGMIMSGGLAMVLAAQVGWENTYATMAAIMALMTLATLKAPEPEVQRRAPRSLYEAVQAPFTEFFSRRGALAMLLLIVLYKLGDSFASALSTTFLLREAGFSLEAVGYANKVVGLAATILGALLGGALMVPLGLYRALLLFGVLQAVSNFGYWYLSIQPESSIWLMGAVISIENLCGGLGTTAFVALVMALCNQSYSAAQFALLSALSAVGRTYLAGPLSGYMVKSFGWPSFFLSTVLIALPGLVMLWHYRSVIRDLDLGTRDSG